MEPCFSSFTEVLDLDLGEKRALLRAGDAVERVWAAWALGLELGAAGRQEILDALQDDPSPGARRQILVVLAGLGERLALRVFAESDPDGHVRATALQYLARTSAPEDAEVREALVEQLFADQAAVVRRTILDEALAGRLEVSRDGLMQLVGDPDPRVGRLAVEALVADELRRIARAE